MFCLEQKDLLYFFQFQEFAFISAELLQGFPRASRRRLHTSVLSAGGMLKISGRDFFFFIHIFCLYVHANVGEFR